MLYLDIFKTLNEYKVRYLVVGGIAVNLHGIQRATADLDLIVALDSSNLEKFISAIKALGYKPKVPVHAEDFCNPENRRKWREEKGMMVFSFFSPKNPLVLVDVFVYEPISFDEMNKMKNNLNKLSHVVTADEIKRYRRVSTVRKLEWLEEMNRLFFAAMTPALLKRWQKLREKGF